MLKGTSEEPWQFVHILFSFVFALLEGIKCKSIIFFRSDGKSKKGIYQSLRQTHK